MEVLHLKLSASKFLIIYKSSAMSPYTIIFIGPQGSGKGTQIEKLDAFLSTKFPTNRVIDIQTGRRFRAMAAKRESFTEEHVAETLNTGVLQPLFLSVLLWGDAMREHLDSECHLLIDGFPRVVDEAKVLESALAFYNRTPLSIINLETPEEIVRERMVSRARADDTSASIEARLKWYREETLPVLEYYRSRPDTFVHDIDGLDSIEGVHEQILSCLKLA
jgi:adenylate kinase